MAKYKLDKYENVIKDSFFKKYKNRIITSSIIFFILALVYISGIFIFSTRFQYNTTINGVDVSFQTPTSIEKDIDDKVHGYSLDVISRNYKNEKIYGCEINIRFKDSNGVDNLLSTQNKFKWPLMFIPLFSDDMKADVSFDQAKLVACINKLKCMDDSCAVVSRDAEIKYNQGLNQFYIEKEVVGTQIDKSVIYNVIENTITNFKPEIDLFKSNCYMQPNILSTDQNLKARLDRFNKLCLKSITYKLGSDTKVLRGDTIVSWLIDNNSDSFNDDAIRGWIKEFGAEINSVGSTRTFTSLDGNTYEVKGGTYGFELDEDKEFESIKSILTTDKNSESREPFYSKTGAQKRKQGEADWGNTYAEVNLTTQHMMYIKDGVKIFEADIVSGLPTPKKETPCGVYDCLEKKQNKVLRGQIQEDGRPEYETPVAYWMRITWTGVGFHTATWQPRFGGNRYKYAGSHGCINMSYNDSKTLYGIIELHVPVVMHK